MAASLTAAEEWQQRVSSHRWKDRQDAVCAWAWHIIYIQRIIIIHNIYYHIHHSTVKRKRIFPQIQAFMLRLHYLGLMRTSRLTASDKSYFPLDTFHSRTFSGLPEEQRRSTVTRLSVILYLSPIFLQTHMGSAVILHTTCEGTQHRSLEVVATSSPEKCFLCSSQGG